MDELLKEISEEGVKEVKSKEKDSPAKKKFCKFN